jgi:hypothetical protein
MASSFTGSAHGSGGFSGSADGTGGYSFTGSAADSPVAFNSPAGFALDAAGNIFVSDSQNHAIRKIPTDGTVTTLGDTPEGFFYNPLDLAVSANGTIFVADTGDNRIAMSFTPAPEITIELPGGISLSNNESATTFGAFLLQNTSPRTYTVRNTGYVELDSLSVTKTGVNAGGLYTKEQLQALSIGTPLISKNPTTGNFELTVGLQKSTNLQSFQHFSLQDTDTTIEPDGRLKIRFSVPDNAAFFRLLAD